MKCIIKGIALNRESGSSTVFAGRGRVIDWPKR